MKWVNIALLVVQIAVMFRHDDPPALRKYPVAHPSNQPEIEQPARPWFEREPVPWRKGLRSEPKRWEDVEPCPSYVRPRHDNPPCWVTGPIGRKHDDVHFADLDHDGAADAVVDGRGRVWHAFERDEVK